MAGSVVAMIWLAAGPIVAGLEDGKVRALNCKTNKSHSLFGAEHMVVSLAANGKGTGFVSGHDDGTVVRFFVSEEVGQPSGRLFGHSTAPVALAWTQSDVVAAGCDKKIAFYDNQVFMLCEHIVFWELFIKILFFKCFRVDIPSCLTTRGTIRSVSSWLPPAVRMDNRWPLAASIGFVCSLGVRDNAIGVKRFAEIFRTFTQSLLWPGDEMELGKFKYYLD